MVNVGPQVPCQSLTVRTSLVVWARADCTDIAVLLAPLVEGLLLLSVRLRGCHVTRPCLFTWSSPAIRYFARCCVTLDLNRCSCCLGSTCFTVLLCCQLSHVRVFILVHKMDLVKEENRDAVFLNRQQVIQEASRSVRCTFFKTSIWDETLYKVSCGDAQGAVVAWSGRSV